MDTFGNYPGSILKTLTVEQDALVGGDLTVDGDLTVNGSIVGPAIAPDRVYTEDGTESLPAYSFQDEKNTGWYRSAPGEVSFSGRGTKRLRVGETSSDSTGTWAATKFYSDDGTATAPAVSFTSDTTSGWYKSNPGETAFTSLGTPRFTIGQITTLTPNPFTSLRTLVTDGTAATPSTTYVSEQNTGWYLSAPGEVSYSGRGTRRLRLGETSADYTGSFSASSLTSSGTVTGTIWQPQGTVAMLTTSVAPAVQLVSSSAALQFNVGGNTTGSFTSSGASFPFGASALVLTATSSSLGAATATSLTVPTLTSTTSSLGAATCSSLTVSGSVSLPTYRLLMWATSSQTIPDAKETKVEYNGVLSSSNWGTVSSTTDFKVPVSGFYMVTANITYDASTTTTGFAQIWMNVNLPSTDPRYGSVIANNLASTTKEQSLNTGTQIYISTTDTFSIWTFQDSGGTRDLLNSAFWSRALLTMQLAGT